jgi:hypothetical protein
MAKRYIGYTDVSQGAADLESRFVAANTKALGFAGDTVTDDRNKLDTLANVTLQPNGGEIDVIGAPRIAANVTIPANVRLNFRNGAYLAPDGGVTVTINGPINRQLEKKFGGGGTILFGAVKKVPYVCPEWWGSTGDGVVDDFAPLSKAVVAGTGRKVVISNDHKITDELLPLSNTTISLVSGEVHQTGASKNAFRVVQKDNVHFEFKGGSIKGEGTYSAAWVSEVGHEDRGIQMLQCTNSSIKRPRIRNCGLAGVVIRGGTNIQVTEGMVEGTHALSTPLAPGNSYQFGYLIEHDLVYGECEDVNLSRCTAFNVNFGVNTVDQFLTSDGAIGLFNCYFRDIIGQHGAYIGTGFTTILGLRAARCHFNGWKIFSGLANEQIASTDILGFKAWDCGGDGGELGVSGTGFIYACQVQGTVKNCGRSVTVDGDVRRCTIKVKGEHLTLYGFYVAQSLTANGPTDNILEVDVYDCAQKGILVNAPNSARNILRFKGRRCSTGGGGHWMIGVASCTSLTIESPDVTDDFGNMSYCLYVQAGTVRLTGSPNFQDYTTNGVRVDAPAKLLWTASVGDFVDTTTAFAQQGNNIEPKTPIRIGRQTTVNANVPLWQWTLEDESVYEVTARISGKLAGSVEAKVFTTTAMFRRDAAGVALLTGTDEDVNITTGAGFVGTYTWSPTANDARLLVNSAAAATYDWVAEIVAQKRVG